MKKLQRKIDSEAIKESNPEPVYTELELAKIELGEFIEKIGEDTEVVRELVNNLIKASAKEALILKEEITVYYPEQTFGPVPYNSFRVGNMLYKTVVLPGETPEDAHKRAWEYISARVKEQFIEVKKDFWTRYESMTI